MEIRAIVHEAVHKCHTTKGETYTQIIEAAIRNAVIIALTEAMNECARIAAQEENAAHSDGVWAANAIEHAIFEMRKPLLEAIRAGGQHGEG